MAEHIAGAGEPDGIAKYIDHNNNLVQITLEAKFSAGVPSLSAIDFAGLHEHKIDTQSAGCLLVAPSYPGQTVEGNAVSSRARELKISCWTVDQVAKLVELAEDRHFNANHIIDIVLNCFGPEDVEQAVNKLVAEPEWSNRELYDAILSSIDQLSYLLKDRPRTMDMIATAVSLNPKFPEIKAENIEKSIRELANASQGGMTIRDKNIIIHVNLLELRNRVFNLTKTHTSLRRISSFRENNA